MAKPPGFDEWIKIANETGKTPEERQKLRNDVYRRYGMKPPSDRGGVAGIWDRNKQIIKPVVQFTAGYFGGPGAAAGAGALMEGADRPGKRGVGFDVGAGVRGGIQGYGMGQLASAVPGSAGAKAAAAAPAAATTATPAPAAADVASAAEPYSSARNLLAGTGDQTDLVSRAMQTGRALDIDTTTPPPMFTLEDLQKSQYLTDAATINTAGTTPMNSPNMLSQLLRGAGTAASNVAGNVADYLKNMKPEVLQGILQGGGAALGGYLNRGAEEQRLEFMREQQRLEQERMNRLARLLMPMAEAQGQRVGAQYGGAGMMG